LKGSQNQIQNPQQSGVFLNKNHEQVRNHNLKSRKGW